MLKLKISTKVEFGIIAVIDIASHSLNGNAVTTPEIAKRQNISKSILNRFSHHSARQDLCEVRRVQTAVMLLQKP